MPDLPWTGVYVRVKADRSVQWVRCAVCDRPLKDPISMQRGVGPDCAQEHGDQKQDEAREDARELDRARWRRGDPSNEAEDGSMIELPHEARDREERLRREASERELARRGLTTWVDGRGQERVVDVRTGKIVRDPRPRKPR